MEEYKIVWIASYPRSGSMWAFNTARAILSSAGRAIEPAEVTQFDREMISQADRALEDRDPNRIWVLKVHSTITPGAPGSRFIHTRRDPRDALVSFMRFMDFDFETAHLHIPVWIGIMDHYKAFPDSVCLSVAYADIVNSPREVVKRIGEFLQVDLSARKLDEVASRYSKEQVRSLIAGRENDLNSRILAGKPVSSAEVVTKGEEIMRVFDPGTGFQSGHVSDYQEGGWRSILSDEQKRLIQTRHGAWLCENGYEP